jgi:hypothetical protein
MNSHRLTRFRWEFIRWGGTACCAGRVQPTALSLRFSTQYCAERRLGLRRGSHRAAADAHVGQAACSVCDLQFSSSVRASTGIGRELPCPSPNRVGHLLSSTHHGVPAFHRVCRTRRSHASPVLHAALRHRFHGSTRLILAVLGRVQRAAKVVAGGVCRPGSCHPGRSAQHSLQPTALSGRFSTPSCADRSWRLTLQYSSGGRLSATVGQAAFCGCGSSSAPQRSPLRADLRSHRGPHKLRTSSALVGPPSRSCQPPLSLHSRRVCFAVARLGASPLLARLGTADSGRARPCVPPGMTRCTWCVPTEKLPPRPLRPTLAAADRPLAAIFHRDVCELSTCSTAWLSSGGRLSFSVGLAAFSVCCSSSSAQRVPPPATHLNRRARHTTASVICARRPALAFLPATVCSSLASRTLRHRPAWRFAAACTARHGSFLPCSSVARALQKSLRLMCAD